MFWKNHVDRRTSLDGRYVCHRHQTRTYDFAPYVVLDGSELALDRKGEAADEPCWMTAVDAKTACRLHRDQARGDCTGMAEILLEQGARQRLLEPHLQALSAYFEEVAAVSEGMGAAGRADPHTALAMGTAYRRAGQVLDFYLRHGRVPLPHEDPTQ